MSDGLFPVVYSDLQTVCYLVQTNNLNLKLMQSVLQGNLFLTIRRVPEIVTRLKNNAQHTPLRQGLIEADPDGCWGLYEMKFTGAKAKLHCSETNFRVVQWLDKETNRWFEFLTNSQELSATEVADLYKERWQIELFFKRIKQNLVIKTFVGTTENAVMTQI